MAPQRCVNLRLTCEVTAHLLACSPVCVSSVVAHLLHTCTHTQNHQKISAGATLHSNDATANTIFLIKKLNYTLRVFFFFYMVSVILKENERVRLLNVFSGGKEMVL